MATEMRRNNLAVLEISETHWIQVRQQKLDTGEMLVYSSQEEENAPHTQVVGSGERGVTGVCKTAIDQSHVGICASCVDCLDIDLSHKHFKQRWIVASSGTQRARFVLFRTRHPDEFESIEFKLHPIAQECGYQESVAKFQVRACLVMQFDDLRNVCPIHFHRLFLISSAGSWNAALALPILDFTSASEPPCSSTILLRHVKDSTSSRVSPSRVIELLFSVL
ncbi:unnamed protein product [Schistosoma margrebowiei]|uniref:Uncharacterized protein n=1 Tax=Schistosoma margrebowiei TaxID=48269 RepID=A0A183MYT0_9TREM|nr:unnamed protein product [Schistosoma margrebowiei]